MNKVNKDNPPYISDDFQIGPDGAYEHTEDITLNEKTMTDKEIRYLIS
jgi:hypothetical protein